MAGRFPRLKGKFSDGLEVLVFQICGLAPGTAVPHLLPLVLGRLTHERLASLLSGVLLKAVLRRSRRGIVLMPIETLPDIVEELADKLGIYGAHGDENEESPNDVTCTPKRPCRICFTSDLSERIVAAMEIQRRLDVGGQSPKGEA